MCGDMNIKPFVVRLSDEEHELFRKIAFDNRVSIQQIFKKMVKEYLKEYKPMSELQSDADVVEVVRCKDCVFGDKMWCNMYDFPITDNFFCSGAERKPKNEVSQNEQPKQ